MSLLIPTVLSLPCSLIEITRQHGNVCKRRHDGANESRGASFRVGASDSWDLRRYASVGLQLVGSRLNERVILDVAKVLEGIFINDTS